MTATRQQVWKATYEPFGTVVAITGAAANNGRLPGQWYQLEAGLAYNWNRHYDATLGRYTQGDPLADNRPAPLQAASSLGRDAAPGTSFLTDARMGNLTLGAAPLSTGLGYLLASREDGAGPTAGLFANPTGAVPRDGPSLYGYARQSPVMWTDRTGLQQPFSPDATALIGLARRAKRTGVTPGEAQCLLDWAQEYGVSARGPESHPTRGYGSIPHIHIGPIGHIAVK